MGALAGAGLYPWRIEPHRVQVVERYLPISDLPTTLSGKTLLQISDLHIGAQVDSAYVVDCLRRASSLHPDLMAITGDFMTCRGNEQVDEVARVLEHLAPAPLGCFAILGNHDYGEGWRNQRVADALVHRLAGSGVRVLRNEIAMIEGLQVMGLDDLWAPNFRPADVLSRVNPVGPILTLCHNPDAVDLPGLANHPGWVLSGHTHGGQCKPPFLPPPLLPVKNRRYTSGDFDLRNGRRLYINRGLGHLLQVRFNCRPEITLFRLSAA